MVFYEKVKNYTLAPGGLRVATDEADSDNKFSPEDYGDEDKENNEADVEFEFEMKSDSDSEISAAAGLPPVGYHR
jgi:hypothetical protein